MPCVKELGTAATSTGSTQHYKPSNFRECENCVNKYFQTIFLIFGKNILCVNMIYTCFFLISISKENGKNLSSLEGRTSHYIKSIERDKKEHGVKGSFFVIHFSFHIGYSLTLGSECSYHFMCTLQPFVSWFDIYHKLHKQFSWMKFKFLTSLIHTVQCA
jgi:hypothetical protein